METHTLAQSAVRVADYDAAKKWYLEKMDFRLREEWLLGSLQLAHLTGKHSCPEILIIAGPQHCCMNVPDVDRTLDDLRRREVKILGEPCNVPLIGKRIFFLSDPWGNLIEIAEELK